MVQEMLAEISQEKKSNLSDLDACTCKIREAQSNYEKCQKELVDAKTNCDKYNKVFTDARANRDKAKDELDKAERQYSMTLQETTGVSAEEATDRLAKAKIIDKYFINDEDHATI